MSNMWRIGDGDVSGADSVTDSARMGGEARTREGTMNETTKALAAYEAAREAYAARAAVAPARAAYAAARAAYQGAVKER